MVILRHIGRLFWDAGVKWWNDDAMRLGATIAFYTIFSLSPLVLFIVSVSARFFEQGQVQTYLIAQFENLVGEAGAKVVTDVLEKSAEQQESGLWATIVAAVTLFIGATAVFIELRTDLNRIWRAKPPKGGPWDIVRERFLSFALVLVLGFLLLVSLALNAALAGLGTYLKYYFPEAGEALHVGHWALSFLVIMALFAMMFRLLPDAKIAWGDVWIGAAITTILFNFGKFLIGYYLGTTAAGSPYGAAGSFVVFLLWIYYSTQILLYGAEITELFAARFGSGVKNTAEPRSHLTEQAFAETR